MRKVDKCLQLSCSINLCNLTISGCFDYTERGRLDLECDPHEWGREPGRLWMVVQCVCVCAHVCTQEDASN